MSLLGTLRWTAAGLAATPLLEWAWHAFVAHGGGGGGGGGKAKHATGEAHLDHHRTAFTVQDPWEEMRDNAPLIGRTLLAAQAALVPLFGARRSLPVAAGLLAGYAFTTVYHAKMHQRAPRSRYEEWMWRFHWHHHAADARVNFGLTNPVFDFVFGTAVVPREVEVPERFVPAWLSEGSAPGFRIRKRS